MTGAPALERLHPVRLLGALVCAGFVLAAAAGGWSLPAIGPRHSAIPAVLAGLIAFNVLLFFAPCALALHPRRFAPILAANVVPVPLVTILYAANPLLADLVLVLLAPAAVFARARGPTVAALATIIAINTLVALLFAGTPGLARLGVECGVIGTFVGFAADATSVTLLRTAGLSRERRLLRTELARFLADLSTAWGTDAAWPTALLSAHATRLQGLVADLTLAASAARKPSPWPQDVLPPEELIEALNRSVAAVHGPPHLSEAENAQVRTALAAVSEAAGADALTQAEPAVQTLREASTRDVAGDDAASPQLLGIALLLSDVVQASRLNASVASAQPVRPAPAPTVAVMPDAMSLRLALQAAVCMVLALGLMHVLPFPKPYWLPLTTFILVSTSFGESARKSVERILGTGAGLIVGQLIWMAAAGHTDVLTVVIAVSLFGLFFARTASYRVLLFWLTVMLSVVLHIDDAPLSFYAARLADTLIGTCIVLIVTGLLLPVRTDDAMRARLATLLALGANRLADAAAALRIPGQHGRAGMLDGIVGSAQALRDLAAAEELENGLLRRPRGQPARRQAAIDRLVRILLYVDQLLPILSASPMTAESLDLLGDMAAAAQDTSHRVGADTAPGGFATLRARSAAQKTALVAGFASGTIAATHFEAERRLLETMDGLLDVLETLEATMAASRKAR